MIYGPFTVSLTKSRTCIRSNNRRYNINQKVTEDSQLRISARTGDGNHPVSSIFYRDKCYRTDISLVRFDLSLIHLRMSGNCFTARKQQCLTRRSSCFSSSSSDIMLNADRSWRLRECIPGLPRIYC